jgi:hypothetical protein
MVQEKPNAEEFGAIGYREDFTDKQLSGKHIDSLTGLVFDTEEAYCKHTSPVTGYKPTDPEHQGPGFEDIQKAALERGEARKDK